ncbi:hypothetical protein [Pyruvatibacter sp.]|uniref:hypothetical protein n=1 Tax=Pyruvatibacter sp. TaxID=1981328 RepID=UPI0032EF26F6
MSDERRQVLNIVTAISQALAPAMPALGFGITVGARDGVSSPLEVPAGYAFSIWGLIFLLGLIYAVMQALPSARTSPLYRAIGTGTWMLFGLSTAWMLVAQFEGPNIVLATIIVIMLVISLRILVVAFKTGDETRNTVRQTVVLPLLGLYAGWLTLATALNVSGVLRDYALAPFGLQEWQYVALVLGAAALVAVPMLLRLRGLIWYAAAAIWGLVGIILKAYPLAAPEAYVAYVAAAITTLLLLIVLRGFRRA